jgi:cell wall-associated NlpC family hydrolase
MRVTRLAHAGLVIAALVAGSGAARAALPPELKAKQARARAVLVQVNALGIRFGRVVDAWDGAKIELGKSERQLAANERALRKAREQTRAAEARLAARLVAVYESGEPSLADVLLGATSLTDLVDRVEAANRLVAYDHGLAEAAARSQARLAAARRRLQATEHRRRATVAKLAANRRTIAALLERRRRLLASVRSEVAVLQRQEAARQKRLAARARARLAREHAEAVARAKAEAVARAKAEAAAKPKATSQPAAATASTTTAPTLPVIPTPATTATAAVPAATTSAGTTAVPDPGPGVAAAATLALRYLGIPYRWGGASPTTGFDCSGLVMYVYAQLGIALPHQAAAQYAYGVPVSRSQLLPGDLVFYDALSHVAIYIGNGQVVHAPQTGDVVRIASLDAAGGTYVGARRLP